MNYLIRKPGYISSYLFIMLFVVTSILNAQKSKLSIINIEAPSMANNLLNLTTTQSLVIYLPPSYENSNIRYPVVYFLPGYGDQVQYWTNGTYQNFKLQEAMDRLISNGTIKEFIVVIPNGYNFLGGSFYVNSPVTGNCEDFVVKDVVKFIDANYRTIDNPASRGISGHSMGGFGALSLAMHHSDIFGSVYSLSPGLFDLNGLKTCQLFKSQTFISQFIQKSQELYNLSESEALSSLKTYIQGRFNAGDWDTPFTFAYGAAFSPNPDLAFPHIDYPFSKSENSIIVDSTKLMNYENGYGGFSQKVITYKENLSILKNITIDYGLNDYYQWIPAGCEYFSDLLTTEGIEHKVVTFNGGHEDQVRKRIEEFLLPAFSKILVFDSTTTDIKLNQITPTGFEIFQNYPNPFNPITTISFHIPKESTISLSLFNLLGEQVSTLVNNRLTAGTYNIKFDGSNLSSGIYLCSLNVMERITFRKTIKIALMK